MFPLVKSFIAVPVPKVFAQKHLHYSIKRYKVKRKIEKIKNKFFISKKLDKDSFYGILCPRGHPQKYNNLIARIQYAHLRKMDNRTM